MDKCWVCDENADMSMTGNFDQQYTCLRCGKYLVRSNVLEERDKLNTSLEIANASAWIRENQIAKIDKELFAKLKRLKTPTVSEKAEKILVWLNKQTIYPGQHVVKDLADDKTRWEMIAICWASNEQELQFYFDYLYSRRLIQSLIPPSSMKWEVIITSDGFAYLEKINKNINSNLGFCAMWFGLDKAVYDEAIEPAIKLAGYESKRIDLHPHNTGIVDEVIALIRRSKFVIADMTRNRGGVYFEAGFAKGLGREVIFTCRKNYLGRLHFDVKHFNFLIWELDKLGEFKESLRWRIESTLGKGIAT